MRNFLVNSDFYLKVFYKDPDFRSVFLYDLDVSDGCLHLNFDLPGVKPDVVFKGWNENSNTARIIFNLISYYNLSISRPPRSDGGVLSIKKIDDELFRVVFIAGDLSVSCDCSFVSVSSVSFYYDELGEC